MKKEINSVKYEAPKEHFNKTMKKEIKNSPNPNKANRKTYKKIYKIICSIVMGILTMSSIAVYLMFQKHNLYTIKLTSLVAMKSVAKIFPN